MKKILLLFLVAITFCSCENDDNDSIIGSWKVQSTLNGEIQSTSLDECDANIVYHFDSNKNFWKDGPAITSTGYICQPALGGTWKKISGTAYGLMNDGTMFIEIIKVNKDTLIFQNILNYNSDFKKILVRQ